ncbi:MAG: hypothetical protein RI564_12450, partial [Gracilimonas sp.]|nr:hypothetical protein [Gracilimonas sp.]
MKTLIKQLPNSIFLLILTAVLLSACTLGDVSDDLKNQELTPEEIEAASQILGQALSDDNEGVFSSLNDALTTVSSSGFGSESRMKMDDDDDEEEESDNYSGRGGEHNYQHDYDRQTGTHTISFDRSINK